jgi:glutaredoxin-like protein NrdH
MPAVHVAGKGSRRIMLYALSTCGWCRMTRELLEKLGVQYDYLYVDQSQGKEKDDAMSAVTTCSPSPSFPTIVIDSGKCITGYRENEIREAVGK